MPMVKSTSSAKLRILISGLPNTGKTTSLRSFYTTTDDQGNEVLQDKRVAIISAPGEFGIRSLPESNSNVESYHFETDSNTTDLAWSKEAIGEFNELFYEQLKNNLDILVIDGLHSLWKHMMNLTTSGLFLRGEELNKTEDGRLDPYNAARYYNQTHQRFGQLIARLYNSKIPLVICTTWEEWESGKAEGDRPGGLKDTKYLWPAIPGAMAKGVVGLFDMRLSARLETRCCHSKCEASQGNQLHHVWQFIPKGDVMGVGIKGVRKYTQRMQQYPYVHQNWEDLRDLIEACK